MLQVCPAKSGIYITHIYSAVNNHTQTLVINLGTLALNLVFNTNEPFGVGDPDSRIKTEIPPNCLKNSTSCQTHKKTPPEVLKSTFQIYIQIYNWRDNPTVVVGSGKQVKAPNFTHIDRSRCVGSVYTDWEALTFYCMMWIFIIKKHLINSWTTAKSNEQYLTKLHNFLILIIIVKTCL